MPGHGDAPGGCVLCFVCLQAASSIRGCVRSGKKRRISDSETETVCTD